MTWRSATDVAVGLTLMTRAVRPWRPATWTAVRRHGLTVAALAAMAASTHPDTTVLVDDEGPLSHGELGRQVDALAPVIAAQLPPGPGPARVGVLCRNGRGFVAALVSASRLRADVVLLDPDAAPPQLAQVVRSEHLDLVVLDGDDVTAPPAGTAVLDLRTCAHDRSGPPDLAPPPTCPSGRSRPGRLVVLTSGTTGPSRGAHRGAVRVRQSVPVTTLVRAIPVTRASSMVLTPPLFHGYGLGFLLLGLAFRLPVVVGRRLDLTRVDQALSAAPDAILVGVPPVLARVARATGPRPLAAVVSGAGQLHPSVASLLLTTYGPTLFNLYGSSEEGWSTLATPDDLVAAPGTIGRPAAGVRIEVLDDDGRPVPVGTVGRLCVASRLEFAHYTDGGRRRRLGGMSVTGDLGHRDRTDRFFVDGRSDDVVVVGGENVFLPAVEDALLAHPDVADVRVDAVPDEEYGSRLVAVVVPLGGALSRGEEALALALTEQVRSTLTRHMVPRVVRFVDALPQTATGKHLRR